MIVLERAGSHNGNALWKCQCDCGNIKIINGINLRNGDTKSCGCLHSETVAHQMQTHGFNKHYTRERLYGVWGGMLTRTRNPKAENYAYYGGRGIKVCDEWHDYAIFREWALTHGYQPNAKYGECTLDRIDDNGNYCPENCRWVSMTSQANNQRSNKLITYNGETLNLKQWATKLHINYSTFRQYINNGLSLEEIITTHVH